MSAWHAYDAVAMFAFAALLSSPKHYHSLIVSIELALLAGMFIGRWIERRSSQ